MILRAPGLVAALLVVGALGCATVQPPRRYVPLDSSDERVVALRQDLLAAAADRFSLVGSADVSLVSPDAHLSRPQRLALMRPASLRVEIMGLFNQPAAILATDGTNFQLYDPTQSGIQQGRARPGLLWQIARVDLEPDEAIDLLLGAPLAPRSAFEDARVRDDGTILLAFRSASDGGRRIFEFDPASYLTGVVHRGPGDAVIWEASYSDYRALGDRSFAYEIEIHFPEQQAEARFRFDVAELNRDLPESAFVLTPRAR